MDTYGLSTICRKRGFTLLEVIATLIIIGIVAAFLVPRMNTMMTEVKENTTEQNLAEIKKAIIGDPSVKLRGFRQITGTTPSDLSDLWSTASASAANPFQDRGQGDTVFLDRKATQDAWGASVVIGTTTDSDGILISAGPDGVLDGGGDKDNYNVASKGDDIVLILPDQT